MMLVNNRIEMNLKGFPRGISGQVLLYSIQHLANQIIAENKLFLQMAVIILIKSLYNNKLHVH
jgi:hypothetical protein